MAVVSSSSSVILSDEQLLARFGEGDETVLDELFQRYRQIAFRVAWRLLGNDEDALDAVQDGFVKALTNLPSFQGRSTFKTWLLRVVSNAALDLGRQRGRRETYSLDVVAADDPDRVMPQTQANPSANLEREDIRAILNEALDELPAAQRQTFVLHAEAELSYREVAEVLDISIGTVMSRLFYARQKLRALLDQRIPS